MMKVAICDDEQAVLNDVAVCVKNYKNEIFEIQTFLSGESLVSSLEAFDIIILDIDMGGMNGIETAKSIRAKDKKVKIIYLTSYTDYTIFAFAVHAFAYLMKPVIESELHKQFDEALAYRFNTEESKMEFKATQGILRKRTSEIIYFEYQNRMVLAVTTKEPFFLKKKITDVFREMEAYHFAMPHKSFVVNLYHVKAIRGNDIVLSNDQRVPLSQKKAAQFRKQLNCYLSSVI